MEKRTMSREVTTSSKSLVASRAVEGLGWRIRTTPPRRNRRWLHLSLANVSARDVGHVSRGGTLCLSVVEGLSQSRVHSRRNSVSRVCADRVVGSTRLGLHGRIVVKLVLHVLLL
jgi:hypothetical protein